MRTAASLVQRLTDAIAAVVRGVEDLAGTMLPRPQPQLVPVRVRRNRRG